MKRRIVINGPCYKNELSIYTEETQDKIEVFRRARTHWLATADESQITSKKVKESMKESSVYTGRCSCLRKMQLKTTLLRFRYKNVKPRRFWTLRRKLTEQDMEAYDAMEEKGFTERYPKRKDSSMVCSSADEFRKEDLEQCLRDADKIQGRLRRRQRKQECKEKEVSGPCKKAIRRLKASKIKDGIIESCKCEDGREVTVVIKGICLCDTGNLGKVNLNKVCDEYSRMLKQPVRPVEGASGDAEKEKKETNASNPNQESEGKADGEIGQLHRTDSAETKKILQETQDIQKNDRATIDEYHTTATETKKKLTFKNEENLKGDGGTRPIDKSDATVYRRLSSSSHLGFSKPMGAAQSESMNNLFTYEEMKTNPEEQPLDINKPLKAPQGESMKNLLANKGREKREKRKLLGSNKPFEAPQSESMNNLLANEGNERREKRKLPGINKPVEAPQSESMNNLLANEDMETEATGKPEKDSATPQSKLPDENVRPWESLHLSNSLEIYKKQLSKHSHKREDFDKTPSEEDLEKSGKYDKTTDRKTKVRLNKKPTIIPLSNASPEKTPPPHPETESAAKPVEMHDMVTKTLESKSGVSVVRGETAEVNPRTDNNSIVTLYKNQPQGKSEIGLTKEEYERMKQVEKDEQEKKKMMNKKNLAKSPATVSGV